MLQEWMLATAGDTAARDGYGYSEHLLLWSLRRIAAGRAECPVMAREFTDSCGEDAGEVFLTFCTFLRALGYASRRKLGIGVPGSLTVTRDERQVLTLIAAAQSGMPALFEANIRWLTRPEHRHLLQIAAGALATALRANNLWLTVPATDEPAVCELPHAVT